MHRGQIAGEIRRIGPEAGFAERIIMLTEHRFIQAMHALRHHRHRAPETPIHEIYQSSTINAVLEGIYDGAMTFGQLKRHGDFGIGTLNALDGEMVGFDGRFWQITSDGSVHAIPDDYRTPFATVLFFKATVGKTIQGPLDYDGLCTLLVNSVESANLFSAIRVDGTFRHVRTRSVPRQTKPYPPLVKITENQPEFDLYDVAGTLAGFRFPDFAEGMNVPGFHLHFLTNDLQAGGHVLALELDHAQLAVDDTSHFHVELPTDESFLAARLGGDRREELNKAEK